MQPLNAYAQKSNIFKHFDKIKISFFPSIYQSPFDSHQVLNIEGRMSDIDC
jgi:hypothetical protein